LFGKQPLQRLNPDEVVALGAAVQAGLVAENKSLQDVVVTDVCPFTLGFCVCKTFGKEKRDGYFLPVIYRNTTIPVSRVERVVTTEANQTEVNIQVFQGDARRVERCEPLGEFTVRGIPRGPEGQGLDVRFTYDLNGVLEVEATVVETKGKANLVLTQHANAMSEEALTRAIEAMAALKMHPREDGSNQFVLKRAERLYEELSRDERETLSQLLDDFEGALERQEDPQVIEQFRERLSAFLDRLDGDSWANGDE
jgi:molecular chaperone HscC